MGLLAVRRSPDVCQVFPVGVCVSHHCNILFRPTPRLEQIFYRCLFDDGNAIVPRTATSGDDPLTNFGGFFPVGLTLPDMGMRHRTASQDADLNYTFEWRVLRLWEMYGDEINCQDVKYELEQQLWQLTQWKYFLREA